MEKIKILLDTDIGQDIRVVSSWELQLYPEL